MTVKHPCSYRKLCQVEADLCADTCCAGAIFWLIADTGHTANVKGFHVDLGKLEGISIGICYTAMDLPVLQETIIGVFSPMSILWESDGRFPNQFKPTLS